MRLSISNIAWDVEEDEAVAALLKRYAVDAIDIAPSKYFPVPVDATTAEIERVKTWWGERGIAIVGMQSLLFGTSGLNIFGSKVSQEAMLTHLTAIFRIGAGVGATRLVFGSPKNRDRGALSDSQAWDVAVSFFRRLGDIAAQHGVTVCLEPNPTCYGANFMTTSTETVAIVEEVAHPCVLMQLDAGAITINGEDAHETVQRCASAIGHVHVSEPGLAPVGDGSTSHADVAEAVREYLPDYIVTIEMLATKDEPHLQAIERALQTTAHFYRDSQQGLTL
jgi:sugar phosphate isomerase/epimerase